MTLETVTAPPAVTADVAAIAAALGQVLDPQLHHLAQLLAAPAPVRVRPSDSVTMLTTSVPTTPMQLVGYDVSRVRLRLKVTSAASSVIVGPNPEALAGSTSSAGFVLATADAALQLDTRAGLWIVAVTAPATVSLIMESVTGA